MSTLRVLVISILIGIGPFLLQGQDIGREMSAVRAQFDDPGSISWIESFQGTWQGLHPIRMILGFDGTVYLGFSEIGDLHFDLSGKAIDDKIVLQEIDDSGATSGFYILKINEGKMTGHWQSSDQSRSALLSLRNRRVIELRSFQPEVLILDGTCGNFTASLILQREESDLLSGFYSMDNGAAYYRLSGVCEDQACDKMVIGILSADGEDMHLRCVRQNGSAYRLTLSKSDEVAESTGQVTLSRRYPLRVVCDYRYSGSIDYIAPQLNTPAFDSWITEQMEKWRVDAIAVLDSLVREHPSPAVRWSVRSSAWVDLTLITADEISGLLTLYNVQKGSYDRRAFIFDIRAGRTIEVDEMSRKAQFADVLREEAQSSGAGPQSLRHIALTQDGFVLFSDFNHQDGDTWVVLPYDLYGDAYKRNALVRKFLKSD